MAIHNIGEPKCPECGRKFARLASLKAHMLIHEVDENLYCTECDDVFGTKVGRFIFVPGQFSSSHNVAFFIPNICKPIIISET
jgi:uncharacterized Zn-finger protein